MKLSILINLLAGNLMIFGCKQPAGLINIAVAVGLTIVAVVESVLNADVKE